MKALVTGGRGFIGSHLVREFPESSHVIDIKDDVRKFEFPGQYDIVFHLAAKCMIRDCIKDPMLSHSHNALGTFNILEQMRQTDCDKIIYFSSERVMSKQKNPYVASKIYGEELCKAYQECYGIKYKIVRPSSVYGEGDSTDRIVPRFIKNALNNKDLVIYGDRTKSLDITYIKDFMQALKIIVEIAPWNDEFDVGNNKEVNINEMAKFIIKESYSNSKIINGAEESAQPQKVKVDNTKIKDLGYIQKYQWEEGIRKTIKWVRNENK